MNEQWQNSRGIVERVFIRGQLVLETPAHFGGGDTFGLTDMLLLRDALGGAPLLTGANVAGALRNYLREFEHGYGAVEARDGATRAEKLFGFLQGNEASIQSWLIVDDALGTPTGVELRDGVALDPVTRTAEEHKKYDVELLTAGTMFDLNFELLLTADNQDLLESLVVALEGFERGEIGLGQRKRRGLGQCRVNGWRVWRYAVITPGGLLGWLKHDPNRGGQSADQIREILGAPRVRDARSAMTLDLTCRLDSPMLIRSGAGIGSGVADIVHLKSSRGGKPVPILSGTSIAGAIRARAQRIARTYALVRADGDHDKEKPELARADDLINGMFGRRIESADDEPSGSRVFVRESIVQKPLDPERVQGRVKIDRFTGGAYPGALFSEQPAFGTPETQVEISVSLCNPAPAEIGLLLLVLKDVWASDVSFGGESGVGRGRLSGLEAQLSYTGKMWTMMRDGEEVKVTGGTREELQGFVDAWKETQ